MPGIVFMVGFFIFFKHFEYILPLPLDCKVFTEKLADSLMEILLYLFFFLLLNFKILTLSLTFENLIIVYLGVDFFEFILCEKYWTFYIWKSIYFSIFGKFSAIISLNILFSLSSLSSPSETLIIYIWLTLWCHINL